VNSLASTCTVLLPLLLFHLFVPVQPYLLPHSVRAPTRLYLAPPPALEETASTSSSSLAGVTSDCSSSSSTSSKDSFEICVGRALDTLRRDYPQILTVDPDYAIYDDHIQVVDPSGVQVSGLATYRNTIRLIHTMVRVLYCPAQSSLSAKLCWDQAREVIRISWHAQIVPREIFGGLRTTRYIDGISVYTLDPVTGLIVSHKIEKLLFNARQVQIPAEGVIALLQQQGASLDYPSYYQNEDRPFLLKFQSPFSWRHAPSSLFALETSGSGSSSSSNDASSASSGNGRIHQSTQISSPPNHNADSETTAMMIVPFDQDAWHQKNKARAKFGLKPLTKQEFLEIEAQVQLLKMQHEAADAAAAAAAAASEHGDEDAGRLGFFERLFGTVLEDTCESNLDCERPQICCDFGFKKMCCSSGALVGKQSYEGDYALVPVPVETGNFPRR
jgi:Uncharacterized conserved protein (DUF2358)